MAARAFSISRLPVSFSMPASLSIGEPGTNTPQRSLQYSGKSAPFMAVMYSV
ncbi:Uncharacterised protein [Bordetella pertussis]|nr:Uncharacterised protein [Bordetella pertussis]